MDVRLDLSKPIDEDGGGARFARRVVRRVGTAFVLDDLSECYLQVQQERCSATTAMRVVAKAV